MASAPVLNSKYPSAPNIGLSLSLNELLLKEYKSVHWLFFSDWIFHFTGVVLFELPYKGSEIWPIAVAKGPRSTVPIFVCILIYVLVCIVIYIYMYICINIIVCIYMYLWIYVCVNNVIYIC